MRIALVGSHGVGKTSLLNGLVSALSIDVCSSHKVFDSIGRRIQNKSWSEKRKQRYYNYWYIWNHFWVRNYITPRSIYDTWAYSRLMIGPWYHQYLFNWAMKHVQYDYVFYVPIEFDLINDGVRYTDPEFQKIHDGETKRILDFYHIPYHTITGSPSARLEKVLRVIYLGE